ncbi:MAG: HAMP domain-containing protein [Syntrophothermus sp.]
MLKINSITDKLFLYFLTLCMGVIVTVSLYSYYSARKAILERTFEQLISVRVEKTNTLERFFRDRKRDIELLSKSAVIVDMMNFPDDQNNTGKKPEDEFSAYLKLYLKSNDYYKNLILIKNNGSTHYLPIGKSDTISRLTVLDVESIGLNLNSLVDRCRKSGATIIEDYLPDRSGNPRLFMGTPVTAPGNVSSVVILEISIDAINSILYENNPHNGLGKTGESYLVGDDFLMRTSSRFQENSLFHTKVKSRAVEKALAGETGIEIIRDYRDIEVLSSFSRVNIPGLRWMIAAEIDTAEAMVPVYNLRNSILLLSLIISVMIFGIVFIISRRITSPIILLKQAAVKISEGFYNMRLQVTSGDEIGELTEAFNRMTEQLEHQTVQIREERHRRMSSMIDGQELERQRLSRDLHDGLGQSLLAVKMKIEQAKGGDAARNVRVIDETTEMIRGTIREIREISSNLMPPVLEAFGLEQGLDNLCKNTEGHTGMKVEFRKDIKIPITDSRTQIYLYRIAQEAINNITKHSGATETSIVLSSDEKNIILLIKDNGKGYDVTQPLKGNGLTNIRERTELLRGESIIHSAPGKGTSITIRIPATHGKD